MLSPKDISQIESERISLNQVKNQIERFKKGFKSPRLSASATAGNGIIRFSESEIEEYSKIYEESEKSVLKFVPASGAATRMFKPLFEFLDENQNNEIINSFFECLSDFAFYNELKLSFEKTYGHSIEQALAGENYHDILKFLLLEEGLGYGNLPKGLLTFHQYEGNSRTPLEEHIQEGIMYANNADLINIHFTVSPAHHHLFVKRATQAISELAQNLKINIDYSFQEPSTNTLAVDLENNPFRAEDDTLLFRPAGHGALLENLNNLDADIIFVKNIDNVLPDRLKGDTVTYKKLLAGVLLCYQDKAFTLLHLFDKGEYVKK
ncbi:MAG: DUF4301 family protein [Bacteroidota bacterium]